ncbi:hypothetical protein BDF22DRAFT_675132 [Syncephalis plumigaleata]|nr:hypothetical protein BDF22DRAFT_675132 [Syncephalis plumigaleata]
MLRRTLHANQWIRRAWTPIAPTCTINRFNIRHNALLHTQGDELEKTSDASDASHTSTINGNSTANLASAPINTTYNGGANTSSLLAPASIGKVVVSRRSYAQQHNNYYPFDSYKFVQRLEAEGFTHQQSEAIMRLLQEVINESLENLLKSSVTKAEQEKTAYTYKVDFAKLKSEIQLLTKNDFAMMKSDNNRLSAEAEKLKERLRDEIARTQAGVRLDMNLEKGRIRDEASLQELKIRETNTKIETEIESLRTQMETIKFQILQYMIGTITGAGALVLAYVRLFQ